MQVVDAPNRTSVERNNQIAIAKPGLLAWTSRLQRHDENGGRGRQPVRNNEPARHRHVLTDDADVTAPNPPVADEAGRPETSPGFCDRGKQTPNRPDRRRVDAEHFAAR